MPPHLAAPVPPGAARVYAVDVGTGQLDPRLAKDPRVMSMERTNARSLDPRVFGDQPSLDFGGQRNPDGQGFAAFGRVIQGMDVARTVPGNW